MAELSNDTLRRFPHYGDRRNEGTNVEEANAFEPSLDYADNIPLQVDIRQDHSQHMNCLHIRQYERADLTGTTRRPTDFGLGISREEFEQYQNDGLVTRQDDPDNLEQKLAGFHPCELRTMIQLGLAACSGSLTSNQNDVLEDMGIPASLTTLGQDQTAGQFLFARPAMGASTGSSADGLGVFGLVASQLRRWRGTSGLVPAKNLIQLVLTGSVNVSSYEIADVMSFAFTDRDENGDCGDLFSAGRPGDGSSIPGVQANLNYIAQSMCYTSALDFVMDWSDAIENLCLNLKYFNNEFIGFFERGFKSHFWQKLGSPELVLLCWCVQLGMAVRRGTWARNLHNIPQSLATGSATSTTIDANQVFGGVFNPFYMRIDGLNYETGETETATHAEFQAPWMLRYVDEVNYETHTYDEPERGIYQEDLLTGLDIILEEASRELGMGWRSIGRGYMEFFEDFKTATVPDLRSEEARTNAESLRTAWHLGFNDVTDVSGSSGAELDTVAGTSWWREFVTRGGLNETDRKGRLIQDVQDLSSMEFLTGSKFTAGMQMNGLSQTKLFHREDINGNEHTIDLTYDPECKMQLMNFKLAYADTSSVPVAGGFYTNTSSDWPVSASWPIKNRVTVAWPSSNQGYHVYAQNMIHPISHILPGPWVEGTDNLNDTFDIRTGYGRGYSHICYPDGSLINPERYNSTGTAPAVFTVEVDSIDYDMAPMFGEIYYDLAPDGWFPSLMKFTSRLFERWSEAQQATPWKSKWTGSAISGVNLIGMASMSTGEALVQNNLQSLLHGGYCGITAQRWQLESRLSDRALHDPAIHVKPARRLEAQIGMDAIATLLPEGMDASNWLEGQLMLNVELYLAGKLNNGLSLEPNPDYYGDGINNFGNHAPLQLDFYSPEYSYSTATANRFGSNVRVIYHGDKLLNNTVLSYTMTRMCLHEVTAAGGTTLISNNLPCAASYFSEFPDTMIPTQVTMVYDWYDEAEYEDFSIINAAHCVPGMRQFYLPLYTLDPNTVSSVDNSPCSVFGQGDIDATGGSILEGLGNTGRRRHSPEVTTVVNLFRGMLDLDERPLLTVGAGNDVQMWDSDLWFEYCSYRRGLEFGQTDALNALQLQTLAFKKTPFRVLMIDQDVFDTWLAHFGVLMFLTRRQVFTHSTAHAILDKDFNATYSGATTNYGSGGGVASGSTFDTSDVADDSVDDIPASSD